MYAGVLAIRVRPINNAGVFTGKNARRKWRGGRPMDLAVDIVILNSMAKLASVGSVRLFGIGRYQPSQAAAGVRYVKVNGSSRGAQLNGGS